MTSRHGMGSGVRRWADKRHPTPDASRTAERILLLFAAHANCWDIKLRRRHSALRLTEYAYAKAALFFRIFAGYLISIRALWI